MIWAVAIVGAALSWRLGGRPERLAALVLVAGYLATLLLQPWSINAVVAIDTAVAAGFVILAMSYRRWWLLFASASTLLVITAHLTVLMDPAIYWRAYIAYQSVPTLLTAIALAISPTERWLAGEPRPTGWRLGTLH